MFREDPLSKWDNFEADVNFLTNGTLSPPNELRWSHELALTSGWYAEELSGCSLYQPTVSMDIPPSYFIRQLAEYERHKRVVFYPERF